MKTTLMTLSLVLASGLSNLSLAATKTAVTEKTIEYKEGDAVLEGFTAAPARLAAKTPVVVVVHEWMGLDQYAKTRARMLAELGYIAFAADIYGKGVRATSTDEAGKLATKYKTDRALMRKRVAAAVAEAAKLPHADASKVAVIGYCFGGTVALEAARAHLPVIAVASFHGGLDNPNAKDTKDITAKVAVYHGADDPSVPPEQVAAFENEMRQAKADWQLVAYGNAVHKFSNPETPFKPGASANYNQEADQRSWRAMQDFFDEVLKKR